MSRGLTKAQKRLLAWMADGDRALHRCHWNANAYGTYSRTAKFQRLASRKTVEAMVAAGVVDWMPDCPSDLRVMIAPAPTSPSHKGETR